MSLCELFLKLSGLPFGRRIFSKLFCLKAPYFGSVRPLFETVTSGRCEATIKKRRSVLNHIGTVHAIAMCNLAEAVGGLCVETSLAKNLRWIPKGMAVEYLKKAETDLRAICTVDPAALTAGENKVEVNIFDKSNQKVFRAEIVMYISERKPK